MSWLTDRQLRRKVESNANEKTKEAFYGVCPLDGLPRRIPHLPVFIIVNTQTHNLSGEHWKTIFIDKNRDGEVFDSLGQPMNAMLISFMNRFTRRWKRNHKVYQHKNSATCGAFALYYILRRLDCPSLKCVTQAFSSSLNANEKIVERFYKSLK